MINVAFSYTRKIPSRVLNVASNRILDNTPINKDGFNVKKSEYIFDVAPSKMDNHTDIHVFGRNFRVYFMTSNRCTVSPS